MNREELKQQIKELELAPEILQKVEEILGASDSVELLEEEKKQVGDLLVLGADVEDSLADIYEGFADGMGRVGDTVEELAKEMRKEEEEGAEDVEELKKKKEELEKQVKALKE